MRADLGGEPLPVRSGTRHPDVAAHFGRPWDLDLVFSGWEAEVPAERAGPEAVLRVEATVEDRTVVLHEGPPPVPPT
ncbi:MAG: hypothetical protein AB7L84_10705 [Acidimicrobiia bacterium]